MFQNQTVTTYPSVSPLNYYQQQITGSNLTDGNWLGWPMWIATDVIVTVGERQFHAHRSVLCANSGYFRSELSSSSIPTDKQIMKPTVVNPPWAACINAKMFAVLLDFMYSSRLPIDSVNVLELLSAAQILAMPRVIDLCRGYLLQRHLTGCLTDFYSINRNFPPHPPPPPPPHFNLSLSTPENAPAFFPPGAIDRTVYNYLNLSRPNDHCASQLSLGGSHRIIRPIPSKFPFTVAPTATATAGPMPSTESAAQPTTSWTSANEVNPERSHTPLSSKSEEPFASNDQQRESPTDADPHRFSNKRASPGLNAQVKEFVDVACCDGPVKFQRVINQNCNLVIMMMSNDTDKPKQQEQQQNRVDEKDAHSEDQVIDSTKNIDKTNDDSLKLNNGPEPSSKPAGKRVHYQCVYCRHSYKSLCCYLKHKQRHLNPKSKLGFKVGEEGGRGEEKVKSSGEKEPAANQDLESGKPQEINVPFYPCRLCGLKFPSYYFVHKHRRACHKMSSQSENDEQDDENKVN